jgi:hypothetical protein
MSSNLSFIADENARRMVLASLAATDCHRRRSYTVFVLNAVSAATQQALEELMAATEFSHPFTDQLEDWGDRAATVASAADVFGS